MKKLTYWLMVAVLLCGVSTGMAQQRNKAYEDYIKKYRSIAVDEMKHYRIPSGQERTGSEVEQSLRH